MPIPFADSAVVPAEKVVEYLLNLNHPVGGAKAAWFISRGYRVDEPESLENALFGIAKSCEDFVEQPTPCGVKYVATGKTVLPDGHDSVITTVWIRDSEATAPRFVTAYPAKGTSHAGT